MTENCGETAGRRVTPEYVYRMWGGSVPLEDIEAGLKDAIL